ncbi:MULTISPECIES: DcrB-related protein [Gordonia]|nr:MULTISPECIES: DcrB-related protein [Gordonia]MBD0021232.1 DcrB-related protein [Gordonia sp. (in: high G+C Gram-positive bacteria)]
MNSSWYVTTGLHTLHTISAGAPVQVIAAAPGRSVVDIHPGFAVLLTWDERTSIAQRTVSIALLGLRPAAGSSVAFVVVPPHEVNGTHDLMRRAYIENWSHRAPHNVMGFSTSSSESGVTAIIEYLASLPVRNMGDLGDNGWVGMFAWLGDFAGGGVADIRHAVWDSGTFGRCRPHSRAPLPTVVNYPRLRQPRWYRQLGSHVTESGFAVECLGDDAVTDQRIIDTGRGIHLSITEPDDNTVLALIFFPDPEVSSAIKPAALELYWDSDDYPFRITPAPNRPDHCTDITLGNPSQGPEFCCVLRPDDVDKLVTLICKAPAASAYTITEWPFPGICVWRGTIADNGQAVVELIPPDMVAEDFHSGRYTQVTTVDITSQWSFSDQASRPVARMVHVDGPTPAASSMPPAAPKVISVTGGPVAEESLITVHVPGGWFEKVSVSLFAPDGEANAIVSVEPLDESIGLDRYSAVQGDLLRQEFDDYREISFERIQLDDGTSCDLRVFSWRPPDGVPVTQMQLYYVEPGHGFTTTATTPSTQFHRFEDVFRRTLTTLRLGRGA